MSKVDKIDSFLPNRKPGEKSALMTLATDDYADFVSKETQNRRQDRKLLDDITSVLYRLEMDNIKPSFDVLERTGIHKRRSRGASANQDQPAASKGKQQQQQQRRKQQVPDDDESEIVIDPNVIYTADGVLRSKWAPREDSASEYRTLLNQLSERQVERNRRNQPEEEPKDARGKAKKASAAAAAAADKTFSYTLPRSWRHQMAEEKYAALNRSKELVSLDLVPKSSKTDDRIIYVDDLPYANAGSSLQRYAELTELARLERSRPVAAPERVGTTAGSYVRRSQKQPSESSAYHLGDDELMSYLYEPGTGDDVQVRRDVLRPLQRSSVDSSSYGANDVGSDLGYIEQLLLGRPVDYSVQKQNGYKGGYSHTTSNYNDYYPRESRLPYSPPTVVTSPVSRYNNW